MKQLSRPERREAKWRQREILREQGYHPGRRKATSMIPFAGPLSMMASKKYRKAAGSARDQALDERFGEIADEVLCDLAG